MKSKTSSTHPLPVDPCSSLHLKKYSVVLVICKCFYNISSPVLTAPKTIIEDCGGHNSGTFEAIVQLLGLSIADTLFGNGAMGCQV